MTAANAAAAAAVAVVYYFLIINCMQRCAENHNCSRTKQKTTRKIDEKKIQTHRVAYS